MAATFAQTIAGQTMNLDLTRTFGGAKDIPGLLTDLLLIVIRMREAEDLGEPSALRKLINYYLDLFEKNCATLKLDRESIAEAKYALVALVDETVLSVPGQCRDYWIERPMQLDHFGDNLAGEAFYGKLEKMLLEPEQKKGVLEIYYLCLSLGFEGKYKLGNPQERERIIDNLGAILRRTKTRVSAELSPHGRRLEKGKAFHGATFAVPLWLTAVVCAAGAAAAWVLLFLGTSAEVDRIIRSLQSIVN
jgi:type VI secretion system protein ImpK